MADAKGQHEPSMEEILASIRQIISEDGKDEAASDDEAHAEDPAAAPLELTHVVNEDGSVTEISASPPSRFRDFEAAMADHVEDEPLRIQDFEAGAESEDIEEDYSPVRNLEMESEQENIHESEDPTFLEGAVHSEESGVPIVEDVRIETMAMDPAEPHRVEGLISEEPAQTIGSALARLTGQTRLRRQSDPATVEGLVQELLRPMLKEWLDENLPRMVERLVREEIERLTKRID